MVKQTFSMDEIVGEEDSVEETVSVEETNEVEKTDSNTKKTFSMDEVEEDSVEETTTEVEETKGHPYTTWSGETKYHKKIKVPEAHRPKLRKPPIETPPVEEKVPPKGSGAASLQPSEDPEKVLQKRQAMTIASGGMFPPILPSDAISRIAPAAIGDIIGSPFTLSQFVGELAFPETTKKVTDVVEKADRELQKNQIYKYIRDSLVGEGLTSEEEIISRFPAYLTLTGAGKKAFQALVKKITKDQKKLQKTSGILGGGTSLVISDVITRKADPSEPSQTKGIVEVVDEYLLDDPELLKEALEITGALEINPDDTRQQIRIKQLIDSLTVTTTFGGLFMGVGKLPKALGLFFSLGSKGAGAAIRQAKKLRNKNKAVDDGLLEVPENTPTSRINSSEVVEEIVEEGTEPVLKQRNKVTEVLAKINTKAGRMLSNNAALPMKVFNAALQRSRADKASDLEVKTVLEELTKVQKKTKTSDEDLAKIINSNIDEGLDPIMLAQVNKVKKVIAKKEAHINRLLGLTGKDKIGLGFNNGDVYFTRMFEAVNNPTYLKQIQKALKGEKVSGDFLSKVNKARAFLKDKGVPEDEIDGTIASMVGKLSGTKEEGLLLNNMFEGIAQEVNVASSRAAQVLRKRQNIQDPILELLGQETGIAGKISSTLTNQNKVIAELQYLTSVDKFFRKNLGKEIELGGLIPRLGGTRKKIKGKHKGIDELSNLQKLSEEAIGSLGGSTKLLQEIYVDPQTYRYISRGLDLFDPKGGNWATRTFSQIAAYGQATQTIMDFPAYMINAYGATQALIANGVLFNTKIGKQAATAAKTFGQSLTPVRTGKIGWVKIPGFDGYVDPKALEKLDKLKRAGVIDTDLTSEMISKNINVYGKKPSSRTGKLGEQYSKTMQKLSTAYGAPDTYSKLLAFEAESAALRKIFPRVGKESVKEYDNRLFNMAAERVRDTMPSYSVASPLARSLSRMPFGTYALFPSEMVRTTKNQLKYAIRDLREGRKNKNMAQMAHGLKRLTGLGVTGAGTEFAINNNNEQLEITPFNSRAINMLSPDWGKNSQRWHTQPFMEDEDGNIKARFVNSYSFDAQDYLKVPIRAMIGKILGGEDISDVELDDTMKGMWKAVVGPYTNPKFVTEALFNLAQKELYSDTPGESHLWSPENLKRIWKEVAPAASPGTVQVVNKYIDSLTSEKVQGLNKGINAYGFPQTTKDTLTWMKTGLRPITMNLEKSIGFNMSDDIKGIKSTRDAFMKTLGGLDDQPYTPEIRQDLINRYKELQDAKFKAMQDISDKIQVYSQVTYKDKNNETQTFDYDRVLKAVTDGFYYDIPDEIIYAKRIGDGLEAEGGVFMPDLLHTDEGLRRQLEKKSFSQTLLTDLADASAEYIGRPLKEKKTFSMDEVL